MKHVAYVGEDNGERTIREQENQMFNFFSVLCIPQKIPVHDYKSRRYRLIP